MPTFTISAADGGNEYLQQLSIDNYADVAVAALITYEYLLVLKEEIELISDHKITATICILLNRLSLMAFAATGVLLMLPWTDSTSCAVLQITNNTFFLTMIIVSCAVAALRVHIVSGRNWHFVVPTILLGLVPTATNIFIWSKTSFDIVVQIASITTCGSTTNISIVTYERFEIVTRACAIASDVIVVVVTWVKIYDSKLVQIKSGNGHHARLTLPMLLLQEGTSYFMYKGLIYI